LLFIFFWIISIIIFIRFIIDCLITFAHTSNFYWCSFLQIHNSYLWLPNNGHILWNMPSFCVSYCFIPMSCRYRNHSFWWTLFYQRQLKEFYKHESKVKRIISSFHTFRLYDRLKLHWWPSKLQQLKPIFPAIYIMILILNTSLHEVVFYGLKISLIIID
jgi:hypothetical protein